MSVVDAITADDLLADVRVLSGEDALPDGPIVSRNVHHPDHRRAAAWIRAELEAVPGLDVWEQTFDMPDIDGPIVTPVTNVVADLPGTEGGLQVVIGAHYDSIASFDDAWTDAATQRAPGADDDASGVAAVLAIARQFAAWEPGFRKPVRFVLFSGEEYGLHGSFAHVDALDVGVDAMLQLDPVGYDPGDTAILWVVQDEQSVDLADGLVAYADAAGPALVLEVVDADNLGGDARSDHYPFWAAGIPALHTSSFPQPPTYHTMDDTIANVDPTYTREVAVLIGGYAAELVGVNPAPPAPKACGCAHGASAPSVALVIALGLAFRRRPAGAAAGVSRRPARALRQEVAPSIAKI